jgi:tight adherence protein C
MHSTVVLVIGVVAVFVAVSMLAVAIVGITSDRQRVNRSLAAIRGLRVTADTVPTPENQPFRERVVEPLVGWFGTLGHRLTPSDQPELIQRRLNLAGNPVGWDVDRVIAFKVLGLIVGLVVGTGVGVGFNLSLPIDIILAVATTLLGFYAADIALHQAAYTRNERMRRDLPDALDLLTISVEAGLAFDAALAQVARNTQGPLAGEFVRVLQEMQIGLGRIEALRALSERTQLPELRSFITAMVQADTFGVPIAGVLRVQSREQRTKRSQRAEEAAQRVPVKILFPLIFCILPTLFIVVIGPAAIEIYRSFGH